MDSGIDGSAAEMGQAGLPTLRTVCQVDWPHAGHRISFLGFPVAFHRMPPRSQIERAFPQGQCAYHAFESATIDSAQLCGRIARNSR